MTSVKEKIQKNALLREYLELINKIAKVEYKTLNCQHLIEYPDLVNIGIQTINLLFEEKPAESYNDSYLSTAIKWAIRNELRRRYKWHNFKYLSPVSSEEKNHLREAIYKTILSTDELLAAENPVEVKDSRKTPEEKMEFSQMSEAIKEAVKKLPERERELIHSKFFSDKKLHELSDEFNISPSRISRIIQAGLDKVKKDLSKSGIL